MIVVNILYSHSKHCQLVSYTLSHYRSTGTGQQQQANTSQLNTTTQDNVTDIQLENCHELNDNEMDQ